MKVIAKYLLHVTSLDIYEATDEMQRGMRKASSRKIRHHK